MFNFFILVPIVYIEKMDKQTC